MHTMIFNRHHDPCIRIHTKRRRLYFFQGNNVPQIYRVALGKPSSPTPHGHYEVVNKIMYPGGMLGSRWLGLNIPNGNYGIHGTNNPASIDTYASAGCIRMNNQDIENIFPSITIGTPVSIHDGEQDLPDEEKDTIKKQPAGNIYIIQAGDTLWKISQQFHVPLDTLIQANDLVNPNMLMQGQYIIIPQVK